MLRISRISFAGLLAAAALAGPAVAHADVYKWVDEKGGVTYGTVPPPNAKKVTQLDEGNGRVSTVPGPSAEELARQRQLALELRLQRLEQELYDQRMRAAMAASQPYYPYPSNLDYAAGYYGYGGYGYGYGYAYPYPGYFRTFRQPFFPARVIRPVPVHPIVRSAPMRVGVRRR